MATIYVYNPITRFRVRPYTTATDFTNAGYTPSAYPQINVSTCPGEYNPATFVVRSDTLLTNFLPVVTGDIAGWVDMNIVKCWYQRGDHIEVQWYGYDTYGDTPMPGECPRTGIKYPRCLLPEILIKDDSYDADGNYTGFVRVDIGSPPQNNGDNYLRRYPTGIQNPPEYAWISEAVGYSSYSGMPVPPWTVVDSDVLLPTRFGGQFPNGVDNKNRQYWLTIHPPVGTPAGTYTGTIILDSDQGDQGSITVSVTVLPFTLPEQFLINGVFYGPKYRPNPERYYIGGSVRCVEMLESDALNMRNHGLMVPYLTQSEGVGTGYHSVIQPVADAMRDAGFDMSRVIVQLEYGGPDPPGGSDPYSDPVLLATQVIEMRDWFHTNYGTTQLYFISINYDEDPITQFADRVATIRAQSNSDCSCLIFMASGPTDAITNLGLVDWECLHGSQAGQDAQRRNVITQYHNIGALVSCYSNPQCGEEEPLLFRRNFGLYLWQYGYDGQFNFAYQACVGYCYNDWHWSGGTNQYKQHMMTYPLSANVIPSTRGTLDTVQIEGNREGINDLRYLKKLIDTIEASPSSPEKTAAQTYVASLQTLDLRPPTDLDTIRQTIITHILSLTEEPQPPCPPGIDDCFSFMVDVLYPKGDILEATVDYDSGVPSGSQAAISYQIQNTGSTGTIWTGLYDEGDNLIQGQYWQGLLNAGQTTPITLYVTITQPVHYHIIVGHQE